MHADITAGVLTFALNVIVEVVLTAPASPADVDPADALLSEDERFDKRLGEARGEMKGWVVVFFVLIFGFGGIFAGYGPSVAPL